MVLITPRSRVRSPYGPVGLLLFPPVAGSFRLELVSFPITNDSEPTTFQNLSWSLTPPLGRALSGLGAAATSTLPWERTVGGWRENGEDAGTRIPERWGGAARGRSITILSSGVLAERSPNPGSAKL